MGSRNRKGKGKGAFPRRRRMPSPPPPPSPDLPDKPPFWPLRHWGPSGLDSPRLFTSTPFQEDEGASVYFRMWNQSRARSFAEEQYRKAGIDPQGDILLKDVAGLLRSLREEGNWGSLVLEALARMVTDEPEAATNLVLNGNPGEWRE